MPTRARGRSFFTDFMVKGDRYRATFSSREEGELWEHSVKTALRLGKPIPQPQECQEQPRKPTMTIMDLVRMAERKHWAHMKAGTELARNAYIFAKHVGTEVAATEALEEEAIEDFLTHREDLGNSGSTVNRYRASISKVCSIALREGILQAKPYIRPRKEGQGRLRVYSHEEEELIQHVARQWGYEDQANLFMWLCDTGMRLGEAEKLTWKDFQVIGQREVVVIPGSITKNSEDRYIVLTKRLSVLLETLRADPRATHGPFSWHNRRLTRSLWDRLRGHFEWMDDQCVLHTWRHTCASRLVQDGASLYQVQKWLGHKTIMMTQRYAHFSPRNMEELADILDSRVQAA
ncbi:MAG: tyrosine-type recombinase/integrase [bacterium]